MDFFIGKIYEVEVDNEKTGFGLGCKFNFPYFILEKVNEEANEEGSGKEIQGIFYDVEANPNKNKLYFHMVEDSQFFFDKGRLYQKYDAKNANQLTFKDGVVFSDRCYFLLNHVIDGICKKVKTLSIELEQGEKGDK